MQHSKIQWLSVVLVFLFLSGASAWAEAFDPVTPGEALAQEIPWGAATSSQYLAIQEQAAESLASRTSFQEHLDEQFDATGVHGELQNGMLLESWDSVGLAAGVSGALALAAYSLWRRRRREQMALLRAADESALENVFENYSGEKTWQKISEKKGLFGSGAILAVLFGLWQNKKSREGESNPLQSSTLLPENTENFITNLWDRSDNFENFQSQALAFLTSPEQQIIDQNIQILPSLSAPPVRPIKPTKSQQVLTYEKILRDISENENTQKEAQEKLIRISAELQSIWGTANWYQRLADENRHRRWTYHYTHPAERAVMKRRWYWQKYANTREEVADIEIQKTDLGEAMPALQEQKKEHLPEYQDYQQQMSTYQEKLLLYRQQIAAHNKKVSQRDHEIQAIKNQAADQKQLWWEVIKNYWNYQQDIQAEESQSIKLKLQMPGVIQRALETRENKHKQNFFSGLKDALLTTDTDSVPTRAQQFLTQLLPASSQSVQLQAESERVRNIHVYQSELADLRSQLLDPDPYQEKRESVLEKLAIQNAYTRVELGEQNRHLQNAHWTVWEGWDNNRQNMGRIGDLFWNRRYTRYQFSLAKSRQGYSPEAERNLKELAAKAKQEEWDSYRGWEKHYKVHPLEWKKQQKIWVYQKNHLQSIADKHRQMLQTRIEELEELVSSNLSPLWQAKKWLEQTPEERLKNNYTQQLTKAELEGVENPALERDAVLMAQREAEEKLETSQAEIVELIKNYKPEAWTAESAVTQAVRTMKYYASPEGIRHKNMVYSRSGDGNTFPINAPVLSSEQIRDNLVQIKPEEVQKISITKHTSPEFFPVSEGKTVSVIIKMPSGKESSIWGRLGFGGHVGIGLEEEFYDFGPAPTERLSIDMVKEGVTGDQWWDDDEKITKDGDADLSEVLDYIEENVSNKVYKVTAQVTEKEYEKIKNYWEDLYANLSLYSLTGNQCTTTVGDSLVAAGLLRRPQSLRLSPRSLLIYLKGFLKNTVGPNQGKLATVQRIK